MLVKLNVGQLKEINASIIPKSYSSIKHIKTNYIIFNIS